MILSTSHEYAYPNYTFTSQRLYTFAELGTFTPYAILKKSTFRGKEAEISTAIIAMNIPYSTMEQQNNFSEDNNFDLPSLLSDDTPTLSEISEKVLYMKKKQEIERKYKEKIKTRKDGRATSSLADLYPEWMIWRRDCSPVCDKTLKENSHNWNGYLKDNPISTMPLVDLTPKDFIRVFRQWTKDISSRNFTFKAVNHSDDVFTLDEREKLLAPLAGNDALHRRPSYPHRQPASPHTTRDT